MSTRPTGEEAFNAALALVAVAEQHAEGVVAQRAGLARPALDSMSMQALEKAAESCNAQAAQLLSREHLRQLVPGLQFPAGQLLSEGSDGLLGEDSVGGLLIQDGLVVNVPLYLRALWQACQARGPGRAYLHSGWRVSSLQALLSSPVPAHDTDGAVPALSGGLAQGPLDAVIAAGGAALGSVKELEGVLPLRLCQVCSESASSSFKIMQIKRYALLQGYTLHMLPNDPAHGGWPARAPRQVLGVRRNV